MSRCVEKRRELRFLNSYVNFRLTTVHFNYQAIWTAPRKDNKCVTIFAMVAVKPGVWYSYEGPLSKRICEGRRKADDMQPMENENCQDCEDARNKVRSS